MKLPPRIRLTVQASDGEHMPTTQVTVNVENVIEPTKESYEVDVKEDAVIGAEVADVDFEDVFTSLPGVPVKVAVHVSYFFEDGNDHGLFRIDANTGKIYLTGALDY